MSADGRKLRASTLEDKELLLSASGSRWYLKP
jgi:hypothetical protein